MSPAIMIAAVAAGLVLLALGGYFVLVSSQNSRAAHLETRIDETQRLLHTTRNAARGDGRASSFKLGDAFRLAKAMPDRTDMPGVLMQLSRLAAASGVTFEAITPSTPVAASGYQVVPISVVFEGKFLDLTNFLFRLRTLVSVHRGRLDASGRLFTVDGLDFAEGEKKFPQIRATLMIDAYVYGPGDHGGVAVAGAGNTTPPSFPPPSGATASGAGP